MKINRGDNAKDPRRGRHARKDKADKAPASTSSARQKSVDPLAGAGGLAGAGSVEEVEPWKVALTEDEMLFAAAIKKQLKTMVDDDEPPRRERVPSRQPTNQELCMAIARHFYEEWREENGLMGEGWKSWNATK
jgi:hypothetical protein